MGSFDVLALSEAEWQDWVEAYAVARGWQVMHVRRGKGRGGRWLTNTSVVGWPDLVLWHPRGGVLFRELKGVKGSLSAEQVGVLDSLSAAGADVGVWWPRDKVLVERTLSV